MISDTLSSEGVRNADAVALKVLAALESAGLDQSNIDGVIDGNLRVCDGYCHDGCES